MKMTRRTMLQASLASVLIFSSLGAYAQSSNEYVLGTLFPMSGSASELGTVFTNGVTLALEHIKADGVVNKPIVLKAQDSVGTPQGGAVGMSRLANVDKAPYVLLGMTGVAKAAAPIGARQKMVMVNGGGVSPDLAELSPYFWNIIPLANQEIPLSLEWMKQNDKTRLAVVYVDDPTGAAILDQLKEGIKGIGGELVGSYSVPPGMEQFAAIAADIRRAKADVIYFASYGSQQTQIIKQLRDAGLKQQLMTYSIGSLPSIINLPESDGLIFTTQKNDLSSTDPITTRFVSEWKQKHKNDPSNYAQNYYNATWLYAYLLADLEKNNKEVNGDNLKEAMQNLRQFNMAGGIISFNENGTSTMPMQLNQVQQGEVKIIP